MNLKKEQIRIEMVASKTTFSVLRVFIEKPYASFSASDLSRLSGASKSNVAKALDVLLRIRVVREARGGKRKLFMADAGNGMTLALAGLFMQERIANLKPATKNAMAYLLSQVGSKVDALVLFGSCAYGLETQRSDIDVMAICREGVEIKSADFIPYRFEIHRKNWGEVEKMADFVVLEAMLNGIVFKGDKKLFGIRARVQSFPKAYALFRLKKAKEYTEKAKSARGEAKRYYKELLKITLGELESLIFEGRIAPKKMLRLSRSLDDIEARLASEGDAIWLRGT